MRPINAERVWKAGGIFLLLMSAPLSLGAAVLLMPLNAVPVPEPANLAKFVKDKPAAIRLGKALFWDMQVGSDGITACASCHFHAGADNRVRNQVNPGLLGGDETFQAGAVPGPDSALSAADFPLFKLANPGNRSSGGIDPNDPGVLRNVNDVVSSQGVVLHGFDGINAGQDVDAGRVIPDRVFSRNGNNTRRVEPRNAPTVINAVFNFAQFWDGRAHPYFNGVNPFGNLDGNAQVWINQNGLHAVSLTANLATNGYRLDNASLASQAVGPGLSEFEMSWRGRSWPEVGRKMLALQPLAKQQIHARDSVLAALRNPDGKGLNTSYDALIRAAFRDEFWNSPVAPPQQAGNFSQMESNFSLFFGLALQLYQATLVSDNAPFDRFMAGDSTAMTPRQQRGLAHFVSITAECGGCHAGAEFTVASVSMARNPVEGGPAEIMKMADGRLATYDLGYYNIGLRPTHEDIGRGGVAAGLPDLQGNPLPLSFSRQFAVHRAGALPFPPLAAPTCVNDPEPGQFVFCPPDLLSVTRVAVDGAFKAPSLRNVELTGPYMHNGNMATLMQVVEFYSRGGNFHEANIDNLDIGITDLVFLKSDQEKKRELVDFLLALTDERVRWEQAPFDHPQLFVPEGHGDAIPGEFVLADLMIEIPAVGDAGRQAQGLPPLKPFLADNLEGDALSNFHFQASASNGAQPVFTSMPTLTAAQDKSYAYKVTATDADGGPLAFTLDNAPAGMTIKAADGFLAWISWRPTGAQVGLQDVTVRATDPTGLFVTQSFRIDVAPNPNRPPQTVNDAYVMIKGGTLNVAAPGVLVNDSDPDAGDTLTVAKYAAPAAGTFVGRPDGGFSYTPPPTFTGMTRFSYLSKDNKGLASATAGFVSIAVRANRAPLTVYDTASTPRDTALVIDVLGNDSDLDTVIDPANRIDPATVFVPKWKQPDQGGTVTVNADGSISYTPKTGFSGTETFSYAVRDTYSTPGISRAARVTVNVQ